MNCPNCRRLMYEVIGTRGCRRYCVKCDSVASLRGGVWQLERYEFRKAERVSVRPVVALLVALAVYGLTLVVFR